MVFKYGDSNRNAQSGLVVVGSSSPYKKIAPGKITIESSSERDDVLPLRISGVTLQGKGNSEFLTVKGVEPIQSKEAYTHINHIVVNSRKDNEGVLVVKDASGEEFLQVKKFENQTNLCQLTALGNLRIHSWGFGVEGVEGLTPCRGRLTVYDKDKRIQLHTLTTTQQNGEMSHFFAEMHLKQGQTLVVEFESSGDEDSVHAWFELLEE